MRTRHLTEQQFVALVKRRDTDTVQQDGPAPTFTVYGVAMGKPRMTQQDKWKQRPAVVRYRAWCDLVRFAAGVKQKVTLTQGVQLFMLVSLPMPASWSKAKRALMSGTVHRGKPDIDNIAKGVMDALFVNDAFVWSLEAKKVWDDGAGPQVLVDVAVTL